MEYKKLIFSCFNILLIIILVDTEQIQTPQGNITGTVRQSLSGRRFLAFLGIPYAKPPVGDLRFKNPLPFGSWKGVRNATKDGSVCLQYNSFSLFDTIQIFGSEDCLYLNVYTPSVAVHKKYPVMVFIHGGLFELGSGISTSFEPDFLLDKDIVMVVMNYRLGPFGFASTEDAEMSGNWGLKDQALAIKWVQDNIAAYGGNPDSVTLFGQSAGGASVHYHMISPLSRGLFHRGIVMSGSAHCPWAIKLPGEIAKRTKMLASFLDCSTNSSNLLVKCLRNVSHERFIQLNSKFKSIYSDIMDIFAPVVEPKGTEGAFITENPATVKSTHPLIIGSAKDDGAIAVAMLEIRNTLPSRLSELDENFEKFGSLSLGLDNDGQDVNATMKEIRKFYFENRKINLAVIQNTIDMYSDGLFFQCISSAVRNHQGPAFMYLFNYRGRKSLACTLFHGRKDVDYGVSHCDELFYLFPMAEWDPQVNMTGDDRKMLDRMISMWTNFATYGTPTPSGSQVIWDKFSATNMNYLNINITNMAMLHNLHAERDHFWQQLHLKPTSAANKISLTSSGIVFILFIKLLMT